MAAYDNDRGSVASFDDVDEFDDFAGESASFSSRGSAARGRGSRRVTIARGDGDDDEEEDEDGNGHDGRRQRSPMIVPFPVDRDVRLVQELLQRATMGKKKNDDDKKDDHKLTCAEETQPENPDIRYTLRYTSRRGPDVDVMHSAEPIELDLDGIEGLSEATRAAAAHKPQPVIEVFTRVASNLGRSPLGMTSAKDAMHRYRLPPPPPPPGPHTRYYSPDTDSLDTYQQRHLRYAPPPLPQLGVLELHSTFLAIRSPHLASALRAVVEYYPAMPLHGPIPSIPAPYEVLYHHRDALARYKTRQPEAHGAEYALTTARHIDVLLRFLDQEAWGQKVRDEEALHRRAPLPLATADNLWMLYKPGELVFGKYCGKWSAFVVTQFTRGGPIASGPTLAHRVHTWKLQYSGESFNRISHDFQVEAFRGEQAITSLAVIPARFFRGSDGDQEPADVLAEHVRLGKLMWRLMQGPAYMSYEGNLATAHEGDDDEWSHSTNTTGFMSGRVMVDCSGNDSFNYRQEYDTRRRTRCGRAAAQVHTVVADSLPYFAARCDCEACGRSEAEPGKSPFAGFEGVRPKVDEMPATDLYFAVIHKVVDGFILGERRWALFNVDQLREVQFDREAFKFLVLDDEIKMTVRALIGKFASVQGHVSPWPNDFVRNKGQGRIFLLHGSPGVGKTCTAEATAELARRPLISLTAGDLGRHGQGVERSLDYFLKLGERFGAIVLIDEADVYLERRRTSDIARNGLVSVFLRALEYYRGVLFLTTNRVETFDAAFTSRIHVALHYGPLTDEHREKIWLNSFERLERDSEGKVHVSVATREYVYDSRDVRSLEWNGREIRNALQTAVALAETEALGDDFGSMGSDDRNSAAARTHHDKITVTDKHLRAVVKMSRGFKVFAAERQMQDRFGDDDDVSAKNDYDDDESDRTSIICG